MVTRRALCGLAWAATLAAQPARIVSTAPSITELLYALGLGDRVVGVTTYCRYPPEAMKKPKIGSVIQPDTEAIAALRPDLVITLTNPIRLSERLRLLHLQVLEVNQDSIADLYNSFRLVGQAAGAPAAAQRLTDSVKTGLEAVRARARKKPTTMMFVVGRNPGRLDGIVTVGRASYLNEIIAVAGGENIFHDAVAAYPAVSFETVLARNPEVIVDMGDMPVAADVTDSQKRAVVALWQSRRSLAAVRDGRVYAVASDIFAVPGPRIVAAAQAFFEMLHPGGK